MKGKRLWVTLAVLAVLIVGSIAIFAMQGNKKDTGKNTEQDTQKETEQDTENDTEVLETVALTDKELEGELLIDFTKGADANVVFESDGWSNGDVFNVVWTKDNVKYADGKMSLGITKEDKAVWLNDQEVTLPYTAGEARTQHYYGYGDYEVKMKPSANAGTASTFFICTGNYDEKYVLDENGAVVLNEDGTIKMQQNPHDEIDIEFLGKDTTKVQFNFFVNGKGGNEYMYDLGFDASKEYHEYGFRWTEDSIIWFVDNQPVYKVTTNKDAEEAENVRIVETIPSTPGRLLMNYWCGNEDAVAWMGEYQGNVNDNGCEYLWLQTSTKGAPLNPENVDLSAAENCLVIGGQNYLFDGADYTIKAQNDNKALRVTYNNIEGATYKNIATGLTELSSKYNKLTMNVTNNGKQAVKLRIDVQSQTQVSANTKACNLYATQDGQEVYTDKDWGGSQFEIAPGKTSKLEIYFDASKKTEALIIYIDSADYEEDGKGIKHSGDITFSNVAFGTGSVPVAQTPAPVVPSAPEANATPVEADLTYLSNDVYTVTKDETNKTWNVTYTAAPAESYRTISSAVEEMDPGLNRYTVTVKNNGTSEVKIRIDIIGKTAMGKTPDGSNLMACNLAALQDGKEATTDLQWGGSTFTIAAGQTSVLEVVFDATKVVDKVEFFFDTHIYQDEADTHAGNVTLSEMAFIGVLEGEDDGPITTPGYGEDVPEDPTSGDLTTMINGTEVTFDGNVTDGYAVNADDTNNTVNVTYTNIVGNSYKNIWTDISAIAADKDTFSVKIANNGTEDVTVRIDIESSTKAGTNNIVACNQSATMDGNSVFTDLDWGGSTFVIAAGKTVTAEVVYDTDRGPTNLKIYVDSSVYDDTTAHAGNVTFSEMTFKGDNEATDPDDGNTGDEGSETTPDLTTTINGTEVTFGGDTDVYNVDADDSNNTLNVTYTDIAGDSYKNIWANVEGIAADKNIFSVKITNNGTADVKVRIDIESKTQVNANTTVCNLSATQTGIEATTDLEWGGSMFVIPAGSTAIAEVTYDASKLPTNVKFFMDSHTYGDTATYSGDVTFSEMTFKGEYTSETPTYDKLTFWTTEGYTVSTAEATDNVNIKYNGAGNTYGPAGASIADLANGKDTFSFKVTNNGSEMATVRVDIQGTTRIGNTDAINVSATADGVEVYTDTEWGGSKIEVAAGATVAVVVTYDTTTDKGAATNVMFYTGSQLGTADNVTSDVTISEFMFSKAGDGNEDSEEPEAPETPAVTYDKLTFWTTEGYTVSTTEATDNVNIKYNGVGNTYGPAGASIADLANGNNTFSFKITNNGSEMATVRVDIQGTTRIGNTDAINVSATADGSAVYTDTEWGGSKIEVAAGATVTVVVTYDTATDKGAATNVLFYTGSQLGTADNVSSDVTLSEFKFYTVE